MLLSFAGLKKWIERIVKVFKSGREAGLWKEDHKPKL